MKREKDYLAIDIGGTFIKYGIVTESGQIKIKDKVPNRRINYQVFEETLIEVIDQMLLKYEVSGIGLSLPAPVDALTGEIKGKGSMPFLMGKNLVETFNQRYQMKVSCENDGNCAALAEIWCGAAEGLEDIALMVCGTGIGGALVKKGKIHAGSHLFAGEFGYGIHHFDFESKKVQAFSYTGSTYAMIKRYAKLKNIPPETLSGHKIFEFAQAGDPVAIDCIDCFYYELAIGVHNIQYYYDPERILLGGGITEREDFIEQIQERLRTLYLQIEAISFEPQIIKCRFMNDANLIGAIYHHLTLL